MVEMQLRGVHLAEWEREIQDLEGRIGEFRLVLSQGDMRGDFQLYVVCAGRRGDEIRGIVARGIRCIDKQGIDVVSPVELLFFYGPHFAERYGIADSAFSILSKKGIPILAATCTGSAVFLVFPAGKASEAAGALVDGFEVP